MTIRHTLPARRTGAIPAIPALASLALVALLAAACGGDDSPKPPARGATSGSGGAARSGPGAAMEIPLQGPELRDLDWSALFPEGDAWRQYPQVLVYNNGTEPETLDPHLMTGVPEGRLSLGLYEGLVQLHPATLQPIPGVAEWWEISDDGLTYTFHLRDNAKWSNGDPVTAEDFAWSWQRALEPTTTSQYAYQLYAIENAEAFNTSAISDFEQVGAKAVDAHTFVVTLTSPTPYFLGLTSFQTLMPVHRATIEKHGIQWTRPENLVGNGAMVLAEWKPRDEIVLVPNEHYWNRGIVRLTKVHAKAIDESTTSYNEYLSGKIDWITNVPQPRIDEVQMHPDYYAWPYLGTYFFRFNVTKAPFDDVRVRKAFNLAVNKASLCRDTLKAGQIPATGYVPPGIHGYDGARGDDYDPAAAKAMLAEAGFPNGEGFPEVEMLYNTDESHKQNCEVLASMWKEVLGINVKLRNMEWKSYLPAVENLEYDVARAGWIGDYPDANTFMDMFVTGGGNNNTGWSSSEYDELIRKAATEADPAKRAAYFRRAEEILCVEDLPILPIYYYVNQGMLRPRVKGLYENIRDRHPYQFIYIDGPSSKGK